MSKKFTGANLVPNPVGQSTKAQIDATKYDASYFRFKAKQEKKHSDGVSKEFEYHLAHDADIIKAIAGGAYRQMDFSKLSPIQRRLLFLFIVVHASGVIGSIQTAKDSVPKRRGDIDAKDDASKSSSAKAESSDKIKNPSWLGNAGNSSIASEAKLAPTMMEQINATANATETARVADPRFIQSVTARLRNSYEALQNATDAGMSTNSPYYQALERNATLMANETLAGYPEGLVNRTIGGIKTSAEALNKWFKEHDPLPNFLGTGVQAAPDDPDGPTPPPPPPPSTTTTTTTRFNPSTNTTITTTTFAPVTNTTVMPGNTTVAVINSTITTTIAPTSTSRVENTTITSTSTTPTTTTTTKTTTTTTTQAPTTTTQDPTTTTYNPTTTIETTTETITTRPSTSVATTPTPTTTTTTTTTGTVTDPATNATYAVTTTNATTTGSTAAAPTNTTKIVLTSTTAPNTTITIATTSSANGTVNGTATKTTAATSTTPKKTTTKSGSSKNGDDIALIVGLAVGLGVGVPVGIVAKVACSRRNIRNRKRDHRAEALVQPNAVYEEPVPNVGAGLYEQPITNVDAGLYEQPVTNESHYYAAVKSGKPKALNLTTDNAYDYAETVLDSSPYHKRESPPRPQFNLVYLNGSEAAADPYYDNVKLDSNVDEDGLPLPDDHLYALATPALLPPKNRTTMTQEEASGQQGAPNPTTMRRERSSPIASQSDNAPPVPPRPGKLEEAGRLSQNHDGGGRTGEK